MLLNRQEGTHSLCLYNAGHTRDQKTNSIMQGFPCAHRMARGGFASSAGSGYQREAQPDPCDQA